MRKADEGGLRHVPLMVVVTLVLQVGSAIWWTAGRARDVVFLERRLGQVESAIERKRKDDEQVMDRLARIEERVDVQLAVLGRIEKQVRPSQRAGFTN